MTGQPDLLHEPEATAPHQAEDGPVPLWQKLAALGFVIVWGTIIVLWHGRIVGDIYPLDRSYVAPNLLASFILFSFGLIAGALLWPPTRRRLHRFADRKLAPIHANLENARADREAIHAKLDLHEQLQRHIIAEHPDIRDVDENGHPVEEESP